MDFHLPGPETRYVTNRTRTYYNDYGDDVFCGGKISVRTTTKRLRDNRERYVWSVTNGNSRRFSYCLAYAFGDVRTSYPRRSVVVTQPPRTVRYATYTPTPGRASSQRSSINMFMVRTTRGNRTCRKPDDFRFRREIHFPGHVISTRFRRFHSVRLNSAGSFWARNRFTSL